MKLDYEIISFKSSTAWRQWFEENHAKTSGMWLRIYKKASNIATVSYAEALDEALCYGWIDGQKKTHDEISYLQKFTPRRSKSMWSKRNTEHIARLKDAGRMTVAGLLEVERAQLDGRWDAAYDAPSNMQAPECFLEELCKYPKAEVFYNNLNKTTKYAIIWRLQTIKTDARRKRRTDEIIAKLNCGEKPY